MSDETRKRGPRPEQRRVVAEYGLDRLPPSSVEAEAGVLGCILIDPGASMPDCVAAFKRKEAFYDLRHQTIWLACFALWDTGQAIDVLMVQEALKSGDRLEQVGGLAYVASLPDVVPSAANLTYYLDVVMEKWRLRKMIAACQRAIGEVYDFEEKTVGLATKAEGLIAQIQDEFNTLPQAEQAGGQPLGAYAEGLKHRLEHYARGIGMITGLPTGFRYLDKFAAGMHAGEVWVIGGDPGSGKTSFAMNVAERVAVDGGNPVGVMSLEMSAEDLILRLLCSKTQTNFHKIRTGCGSKEELALVTEALPLACDVKQTPIYIDDSSGLTMADLRSRLRMMKRRFGIKLALVDYLQLVALTKEQMYLGMAAGYADVARGLQQSAKELEIPVIVLSQLNNEARKRKKGDKPKLTDFRETGAIGDVANFAGILWRPPMEEKEEDELRAAISADPMGQHALPVEMEVVKNKNGPSGTGIAFEFLRWCMRFEDEQVKHK